MTRPPITLTAVEWVSVQPDGALWLAWEAGWPKACPLPDPTDCNGEHCDCPLGPYDVFVQACAPCEMCGDERHVTGVVGTNYEHLIDCPFCRIELVGPCQACKGMGAAKFRNCTICDARGTVTLGYAYAIGQPLPIVTAISVHENDGPWNAVQVSQSGESLTGVVGYAATDLTAALAHYGPPETLVGHWAMQLRVVQ